MRILRWLGLMVVLSVGLGRTQSQTPQIQPGLSVNGFITDTNTTQDWEFESASDATWSLLVKTISGTLDPQVAVLNNSGIIAENDDLIKNVIFEAGIDAISFGGNRSYTIRVGSYSGTGDYRLWLVPAYSNIWEAEFFDKNISRWVGRNSYEQNDQLMIDTEGTIFVRPLGGTAIGNFYLQAEFEWHSSPANTALGFVFRADQAGNGYYFMVTPQNSWTVQAVNGGQIVELQPSISTEVLAQTIFALGVWAEDETLRFYANGELLGEIEDATFMTGIWGLAVQSENGSATVGVDNVLVTVPELLEMPEYPKLLAAWRSAQPADIANELMEQNVIPEGGSRAFTMVPTSYQIAPQAMRYYSQYQGSVVDMVVNVDVGFESGDNIGCGIALRYVDTANQIIAFADVDGGAGLVDMKNGEIRSNTYDLMASPDNPLPNDATRLTIISQGQWITMYVNGEYFTTQFSPPRQGEIGVALLNYSTTGASCGYNNLWIWN